MRRLWLFLSHTREERHCTCEAPTLLNGEERLPGWGLRTSEHCTCEAPTLFQKGLEDLSSAENAKKPQGCPSGRMIVQFLPPFGGYQVLTRSSSRTPQKEPDRHPFPPQGPSTVPIGANQKVHGQKFRFNQAAKLDFHGNSCCFVSFAWQKVVLVRCVPRCMPLRLAFFSSVNVCTCLYTCIILA